MARVPNSQTPIHAAKRAVSQYDLPADYHDYVHAWTTNDDEIDERAIMVGIGGTDAEMIGAGLSYVEPTAAVYWSALVTPRGVFSAGHEMGPISVPRALGIAHKRCRLMEYDRVVILLQERGMWRDDWGRLADLEGL